MIHATLVFSFILLVIGCILPVLVFAQQQTQIPTLQVCNRTTAVGDVVVGVNAKIGSDPRGNVWTQDRSKLRSRIVRISRWISSHQCH